MDRSQLLKNLDTLCGDLSDYGRSNGRHIPADAPSGLCSRLFLSHSMADAKLPTVCGSGVLLSASAIAANNGTSVPVACAEAQLDFLRIWRRSTGPTESVVLSIRADW